MTRYVVLLFLCVGGCGLEPIERSMPTGPAELALSLELAASPDTIRQDGVSVSTIRVTARDANGLPLSGLTVRLDRLLDVAPVDIGTLRHLTLQTDSAGRADTTYRAPAAWSPDAAEDMTITIRAIPTGTNAANSLARTVQIRLVRPDPIQ